MPPIRTNCPTPFYHAGVSHCINCPKKIYIEVMGARSLVDAWIVNGCGRRVDFYITEIVEGVNLIEEIESLFSLHDEKYPNFSTDGLPDPLRIFHVDSAPEASGSDNSGNKRSLKVNPISMRGPNEHVAWTYLHESERVQRARSASWSVLAYKRCENKYPLLAWPRCYYDDSHLIYFPEGLVLEPMTWLDLGMMKEEEEGGETGEEKIRSSD